MSDEPCRLLTCQRILPVASEKLGGLIVGRPSWRPLADKNLGKTTEATRNFF
jgi:hypothetical protein